MSVSRRPLTRPDHSGQVPVRGGRQDPDPVQLRIRQHRSPEASVQRQRILVRPDAHLLELSQLLTLKQFRMKIIFDLLFSLNFNGGS